MTLQEQMDLLQMKEITTKRQEKNGTRIFQLPIKKYGQYIEVGSFNSGYVRRMNCEGMYGAVRSYQLNKCEPCVTYYKDYNSKWVDGEYIQKFTGKYNKYVGKSRILIDNEVDRLEYLISYCLKNYYINQANMIENGKFIPKWKHEWEIKNGSIDKVRELQNEVMKYERTVRELHEEIDRISEEKDDLQTKFESTAMELDELYVTVNGHKYRVI